MENYKQIYTPVKIVIGFNLFTLLAFVVAPYDWSSANPIFVIFYLLLNYCSIFFGYKHGTLRGRKIVIKKNRNLSSVTPKLSAFFFAFYAITFLIKYAYLLRFRIFDISGMFSFLLIGFFDPQMGYDLSVNDLRPHTVSWLLFTLISVVNQIFFIYGFLSWNKLSLYFKIIFIFFLALEIFYWIGRGTGFGIIELITTLAVCVFVQLSNKVLNLKVVFLFVILFISGIGFYGSLKGQRAGSEILDLQVFNHGDAYVDENHFMFDIIPESFNQTYMHNTSYIAQGYYHLGLAMSMDADFTFTYFLGSNPASLNIAKSVGVDLWKDTYMYKLYSIKGVDDYAKWHSAYLWFANDVSFFGVPVIMYMLGMFMAMAYVPILKFDDLLSKIIFVIIINMLIYLFANNTYLYHHFYSFIVFFVIWYFTRIKSLR